MSLPEYSPVIAEQTVRGRHRFWLPLGVAFSLAMIVCASSPLRSASAADPQAGEAPESQTEQSPEPGSMSEDQAPPSITRFEAPSIHVVGAYYGRRSAKQTCSAVAQVKLQCEGRLRCTVPVKDALCEQGLDQSVLIPSVLVLYSCWPTDPTRRATASRPFSVLLSCARTAH